MFSKASFFLGLILCTFHFTGYAQKNYKNEFGFQSDNDAYLFYGQDRYYTNGLMLYFRRATRQNSEKKALEKFIYEISAGQKMYNAYSGYAPKKEFQDRPFAGYLYAGFKAGFFYKNESVLKTGIELGTVGPNALGEDSQELLHKIVGFYEISGWQYQIRNELTANLRLEFTHRLFRAENNRTDMAFESYLNAGTAWNSAGAGLVLRTGRINPYFQSAYTHASIQNNTAAPAENESYFYIKPQLNYVAYDITIQGSLFKDNSPVTFKTKPFVFAQQIGYNYSTPRFTFDFSLLFKSKELKSKARPHQYGSIALYYRFN